MEQQESEKINNNKNSSISNYLLLDITPWSFGTNILNQNENKEIKEEGSNEIQSLLNFSVLISSSSKVTEPFFIHYFFSSTHIDYMNGLKLR